MSSSAAARSIRRRADAIRNDAIAHHHVGSLDSELATDLSNSLVEAVLKPILAALERARGGDREAEFASAVFDLFDLEGGTT